MAETPCNCYYWTLKYHQCKAKEGQRVSPPGKGWTFHRKHLGTDEGGYWVRDDEVAESR